MKNEWRWMKSLCISVIFLHKLLSKIQGEMKWKTKEKKPRRSRSTSSQWLWPQTVWHFSILPHSIHMPKTRILITFFVFCSLFMMNSYGQAEQQVEPWAALWPHGVHKLWQEGAAAVVQGIPQGSVALSLSFFFFFFRCLFKMGFDECCFDGLL